MDELWSALGELSRPSDEDAKALRCVRLLLPDGPTFDVYRAGRAPGPVTVWRVRGLYTEGSEPTEELRAVILGTVDGRALVNFRGPLVPVMGHEPTTRSLGDLSEVIAAALRSFMGGGEQTP